MNMPQQNFSNNKGRGNFRPRGGQGSQRGRGGGNNATRDPPSDRYSKNPDDRQVISQQSKASKHINAKLDLTLPPEVMKENANGPTKQVTGDVLADSIFEVTTSCEQPHVISREFRSSAIGLEKIVESAYNVIISDNKDLREEVSYELFHYYCVSIMWVQFVQLRKLTKPLSQEEVQLLQLANDKSYWLPNIISLYLEGFGSIKTAIGEAMNFVPPTLPIGRIEADELVDGAVRGLAQEELTGIFGEIDENSHVLYENYPCCGLAYESLRHSLTLQRDRANHSRLSDVLNQNALGYKANLTRVKDKFIRTMETYGVRDVNGDECVGDTAINFRVLDYVHNVCTRKALRLKSVVKDISRVSETGSSAQLVIAIPAEMRIGQTNISSKLETQSYARLGECISGAGMLFVYQIIKKNDDNTDVYDDVHSRSWCCVNAGGNEDWFNNRNSNSMLQPTYMHDNFNVMARERGPLLEKIIQKMVVSGF